MTLYYLLYLFFLLFLFFLFFIVKCDCSRWFLPVDYRLELLHLNRGPFLQLSRLNLLQLNRGFLLCSDGERLRVDLTAI